MKNKILLYVIFALFSINAKSQNVEVIVPGTISMAEIRDDEIIDANNDGQFDSYGVVGYTNNLGDDNVVIYDFATNSISKYHFTQKTGTFNEEDTPIAFEITATTNSFHVYGRTKTVGEYSSLRKYAYEDPHMQEEVEMQGIGFHYMKIQDNKIYANLALHSYSDLSETPNWTGSVGDNLVSINPDLTMNWSSHINASVHNRENLIKFKANGNILIEADEMGNEGCEITKLFEFDNFNGNIINTINSDTISKFYIDQNDKIYRSAKKTIDNLDSYNLERLSSDGSSIAETDVEPHDIFNFTTNNVAFFGNKVYIYSRYGIGKISILNRSLLNENIDGIHERSISSLSLPTGLEVIDMKALKIEENSILTRIIYTGTGGDFFGENLPDAGANQNVIIFRYNFNIDTTNDIVINDISNSVNSISSIHTKSVYKDGNFQNEDIAISFVKFNTLNDIPVLESSLPESWGLWSVPTNMAYLPSVSNIVKENSIGKFVDIFSYNPNYPATPTYLEYSVHRMYLCSPETLSTGGEYEIDGLKIYPNPVTDVLTISTSREEVDRIEIFNVLGQKILENNESFLYGRQLDLSHLSSNKYFVKIITKKGFETKLIIKK